jgi:uncharacterized protein (DUF2236 family)
MVNLPSPAIAARRVGAVPQAVRAELQRALVDPRLPADTFTRSSGDPGLFGPGSVTWQIHGDLPSMLVGGMAALMLQALHPLTVAGVADHSAFRQDPLGRLRRTAGFVAVTTFAGTEAAGAAIAEVRRVHGYVHGTAPDGRHYDANDPELLTWVHAAEVLAFVRAYRCFGPRPLNRQAADRYVGEMQAVALALGAARVPASTAELHDYFVEVRSQMQAGAQARTALAFLVNGAHRCPVAASEPAELARGLLVQLALGLLPGWARSLYGVRPPLPAERTALRLVAGGLFAGLRWVLGPSPVVQVATERAGSGAAGPLAAVS